MGIFTVTAYASALMLFLLLHLGTPSAHNLHFNQRALLQASKACSVSFAKEDFSSVTSVCKGPKYESNVCCPAYTKLACKYKAEVNDFSSTCPVDFLARLNYAGNYPDGVFVGRCTSGTTLC